MVTRMESFTEVFCKLIGFIGHYRGMYLRVIYPRVPVISLMVIDLYQVNVCWFNTTPYWNTILCS